MLSDGNNTKLPSADMLTFSQLRFLCVSQLFRDQTGIYFLMIPAQTRMVVIIIQAAGSLGLFGAGVVD